MRGWSPRPWFSLKTVLVLVEHLHPAPDLLRWGPLDALGALVT